MEARGTIPSYPPPRFIERSLDLLFPPLCVGCRGVGRWICAACWPNVAWLTAQACGTCGIVSSHNPCERCSDANSPLRSITAITDFEGTAREAVHALKYESRFAIASMMGRLMAGPASQLSADTIVPVPLHASRRRERGYDQAALLARASARELDIEVLAALQRVRKTRQQVDLSPAERRENVAGAFHANHQFAGDTIILVDDVFTTGSTMRSAARTLLDAGAGTVYGLTFGLAMPGSDRTATTLPRAGRKSP